MKLNDILHIFQEHQILVNYQGMEEEQEFKGKICTDSREIQAGDIFVCIKGYNSDGHNFIEEARKKKAAFIVSERSINDDLPYMRSERKKQPL